MDLDREEHVEQAYFFRAFRERMQEGTSSQELLAGIQQELLSTTKLPMALGFMAGELRLTGGFGPAMARLSHYFTSFQTYVVREAEREEGRFDFRIALEILEREAEYRAKGASVQGIFLYQFETLCRNRLGYDRGLEAMAGDPVYDAAWREWIVTVRRQVGIIDIADLIYVRSEHYRQVRGAGGGGPERVQGSGFKEEGARDQGLGTRDEGRGSRQTEDYASLAPSPQSLAPSAGPRTPNPEPCPPGPRPPPPAPLPPVLFGEKEGKIALANRQKDPLFLFSALARHLGYPSVPRPKVQVSETQQFSLLQRRLDRLESRVRLLEEELRGGINLARFYGPPKEKDEGVTG